MAGSQWCLHIDAGCTCPLVFSSPKLALRADALPNVSQHAVALREQGHQLTHEALPAHPLRCHDWPRPDAAGASGKGAWGENRGQKKEKINIESRRKARQTRREERAEEREANKVGAVRAGFPGRPGMPSQLYCALGRHGGTGTVRIASRGAAPRRMQRWHAISVCLRVCLGQHASRLPLQSSLALRMLRGHASMLWPLHQRICSTTNAPPALFKPHLPTRPNPPPPMYPRSSGCARGHL